jgi:hypothetical protein
MKAVVLISALLGLLAACSRSAPLPDVSMPGGPDDPTAAVVDHPYRPILAGTVDHGIGDRP